MGWRESTIDVDLSADRDSVFRDIQGIKERLDINIELARPDDFVPPLKGASVRHVLIQKIGLIDFYHFDPYSQAFAKIVRGFQRDREDARALIENGMVDTTRLSELVSAIPDSAYARYPHLTRSAVERAVMRFLEAE
jgi:hypothetical protein